MGRHFYHVTMEQRLRDLSFRISCVRSHLMESPSNALRAELAIQLALLEERRDDLRDKLDSLHTEPDCTWAELKAEVEEAWDALMQDFEERVALLA